MDIHSRSNSFSRRKLVPYELRGIDLSNQDVSYNSDLQYFRVNGLSRPQEEIGYFYASQLNSLLGLGLNNDMLSFLIVGERREVGIYLGCEVPYLHQVRDLFSANFYEYSISDIGDVKLDANYPFLSLVIGIPRVLKDKDKLGIVSLVQGMVGKDFFISTKCKRVPVSNVSRMQQLILKEQGQVSSYLNKSDSYVQAGTTINLTTEDLFAKRYYEKLQVTASNLENGISRGIWETQIVIGTKKIEDLSLLSSLIKAYFSESEQIIEPIRILPLHFSDQSYSVTNSWITYQDPFKWEHMYNSELDSSELYSDLSSTFLTTEQLATYFQYPEEEVPNFFINASVSYDVANRLERKKDMVSLGRICNPGNQLNNTYKIDIDDLTRHALIVGMTGSGKTNTSKSLVTELHRSYGVPFWVIESAKREYWDLGNSLVESGTPKVLVFTLGEESVSRGVPFRLNPMEVIGTVSLQSHIDRLFATFKASFDMVAPTPFILEQALYSVYEDCGWDIVSNTNIKGITSYPTLTDLVIKIDEITNQSGYTGEIRSNIQASLKARVNSLRLGGKGMMLDVEKSFPIEKLLKYPVVFELEDLGDDETKSFVIGLLLTQLYEYRQSFNLSVGHHDIQHLLLIEEAHRLLKYETDSDSPKAKAVEFFTNLLAEIRSYGQAIVIADQIPTKLASDCLKNTNLKIVHRTVMKEDRDCIGDSMNMTEEQKAYLSNLRKGYATVYSEGDFRPKLVYMPLVESTGGWCREDILAKSFEKVKSLYPGEELISIDETYKVLLDELLSNFDISVILKEYDLDILEDLFSKELGLEGQVEQKSLKETIASYLIMNCSLPRYERLALYKKYRKLKHDKV
ncbi:ATP-binding protein [Streptococcus suis]|uniref:ATP-binding protein n=1 Tax=Streptococcus suis TaxID=1307 RepID=UPI001554B598|nr:DUF87 domain-containing protein [Streptococcus suis]NQJ73299.1 ATP-binding protein [Streptococcus suis]HEM5173236.1 ATP-binding protein [Streptococcus suis]HEM5202061.1 ATP-binding protein [Streptococcus suis]HEM5223067.1 ATP-binding protein [Streptococcus suis]HEM5254557.1 ATP-binding protein [Streptococcus suis]